MKKIAAVLFLLAVPALAHAPYDNYKFAGAGASGAWSEDPLSVRGSGHALYTRSDGSGDTCTLAEPCTFKGALAMSMSGNTIQFQSGTYDVEGEP